VSRICETAAAIPAIADGALLAETIRPDASSPRPISARFSRFHTGILVLDQAYVEFGGYSAIPLLTSNPNLIITRTFSKAFRARDCGLYMLGTPDIIGHINKIKLPYNINFFFRHVAAGSA